MAGVIATGAAAAAPVPDQGHRMHQGQAHRTHYGEKSRLDGDHRRRLLEARVEVRRDKGRRHYRYEGDDGLFFVGRLVHHILGDLGLRGYRR
ncbi:hypothetical protein ADL29_28195 [Streptomyces chattanoogensis]|uniref:Uncharacterized protein n=1 Tax=Streptomyces chattanoogensis TaxID=66876 RepID=A0A0N0GXI4_9ACTN|nr:hypothetical protein ADL29_28195 [Streptomyces chattanoogensis]